MLIENSEISRINAMLSKFDASDRIFDVKLELLSFSTKRSDVSSMHHSPAEYFCYIMDHCFPDYSFSHLNMKNFKQVKNINGVINDVDYNLSFVVERFVPGFAKDFWITIKDIIPIKEAEIYTYDSLGEEGPFEDGSCVQSFNYFFMDKRQQLVLFLGCVSTGKFKSNHIGHEEQSFNAPFYQETMSSESDEDCLSVCEVPETMV